MYTLVQGIHVVAAILLIMIVLFQSEEGSGFSGAFGASMSGGGNSGKMFGKKGAAGVVVRFTAILVSIFLLTSFSLTYMVSKGLVEVDGVRAPISSNQN